MSEIFRADKDPWPMSLEIRGGCGDSVITDLFCNSFNIRVDVILPKFVKSNDTSGLLEQITQRYYYQAEIPLISFLDKQFIESFVTSEAISGVTIGKRLDHDLVVALLPKGRLVLHVQKALYEQLGIHGKLSPHNAHKRIVEINLTEVIKYPKQYERIRWIFTNTLFQPIKFGILATDEAAHYLHLQSKLQVQSTTHHINHVHIPKSDILEETLMLCPEKGSKTTLRQHEKMDLVQDEKLQALFEWIGITTCDLNDSVQCSVDPFLSTYCIPENFESDQHMSILRYEGLMGSAFLLHVKDIAKSLIKRYDLPYFIFVVWGLPDTPVRWKEEHVYIHQGENHWSMVMDSKDRVVSFKATSTIKKNL